MSSLCLSEPRPTEKGTREANYGEARSATCILKTLPRVAAVLREHLFWLQTSTALNKHNLIDFERVVPPSYGASLRGFGLHNLT